MRRGPFHRQEFSTSIVDVRCGRRLKMVEGRTEEVPARWLLTKSRLWRGDIGAPLELSDRCRRAFEIALPKARLVANVVHVAAASHAMEAVHELNALADYETAAQFIDELIRPRRSRCDPSGARCSSCATRSSCGTTVACPTDPQSR